MVGEGTRAPLAAWHETAIHTFHEGRLAAPIDKKDNLLLLLESQLYLGFKPAAEDATVSRLKFIPHIDNANFRQRCTTQGCDTFF
jgi:hypothetical protein